MKRIMFPMNDSQNSIAHVSESSMSLRAYPSPKSPANHNVDIRPLVTRRVLYVASATQCGFATHGRQPHALRSWLSASRSAFSCSGVAQLSTMPVGQLFVAHPASSRTNR